MNGTFVFSMWKKSLANLNALLYDFKYTVLFLMRYFSDFFPRKQNSPKFQNVTMEKKAVFSIRKISLRTQKFPFSPMTAPSSFSIDSAFAGLHSDFSAIFIIPSYSLKLFVGINSIIFLSLPLVLSTAGGKTHSFNRGMKARFPCFSFTFTI